MPVEQHQERLGAFHRQDLGAEFLWEKMQRQSREMT